MKVTPEQTPITGKRFDILVHSANKLLDPNYASWITSKKGASFHFRIYYTKPKKCNITLGTDWY